MKLSLCVVFSSCCFAAVIVGSKGSESEQSESATTTEKPLENLEGLFGYFKTLENRIRELEKFQDECKSLKPYEKSQEKLKEQIKSLEKQVEEMKNQTTQNHGLWLLTPPLRGPPGVKGDKGDSGLIGPNGENGAKLDGGISALQSITSCTVAMEILPSPQSNKQWIYPHENESSKQVEVLCDFQVDGGGWTVIQKRSSGAREEFNRTWNEYKNGFGSLDRNFWLGLENIRALTKSGDQELRVELEDFEGEKRYAKYSNFSISDASDFYRLSISGFFGDSTAGDSMTNPSLSSSGLPNGMRFSTWDKDNDLADGFSCGTAGRGGWWYFDKGEAISNVHIVWITWKGFQYSLAKTEMKIRKRKSP